MCEIACENFVRAIETEGIFETVGIRMNANIFQNTSRTLNRVFKLAVIMNTVNRMFFRC